MIDFRYHLVSIVSIFLALAVGIALGAGPLKSQIGDTFTSELTSLRADKAALKDQLDQANADTDKRDAFTTATNKVVLAGRLSGIQIAVVALPGADNNLVEATTQSLTDAGAQISGTVRVQGQWTSTANADKRATLVTKLAGELGLATGSTASLDTILGVALQPAAQSPSVAEDKARAAITSLTDNGWIKHEPSQMTSAQAVVVVSGPQTGATADASTVTATALARLAAALDQTGGGTVVTSDVGIERVTGRTASVIGVLRGDNLDTGLTTVDDGSIPIGQASIVLGIIEQMSGGSGRYGLGSDAKAGYPAVPGAAAG